MSRIEIHFESPGLQTTLQDFGRSGHQHLGVPAGGAMDRFSAAIANRLVGNRDEAPVFEITLLGPSVKFSAPCQIALTGADLSPLELSPLGNGLPLPMWETITLSRPTRLTFGKRNTGCRCYLSIAGEIESPSWLGSVSPAPNGIAGLQLRSNVEAGQAFECHVRETLCTKKTFAKNNRPAFPKQGQSFLIPIVRGPEWDQFSVGQQQAFFDAEFEISSDSNRMGYRLSKFYQKPIAISSLVSSGVTPGTIQVTPSGQPIMLMRDAQTTGGYPRIAVVKFEAVNLAAQMAPGDRVRFLD
jgi:antagonist of KipI